MKTVRYDKDSNEVEYYTCEHCGCKFEVPINKRVTTFTLHKPNY